MNYPENLTMLPSVMEEYVGTPKKRISRKKEKSTTKLCIAGVAVISAKNHKRQRRKRQSVTAKREKSQTPKFLTAILTLHNLT